MKDFYCNPLLRVFLSFEINYININIKTKQFIFFYYNKKLIF